MAKHADYFCDGGIAGRNPSSVGGTWCWVEVRDGLLVWEQSGCVTPAEIGLPRVTNNVTELVAAVHALEVAPWDWAGTLYTDSQITLYRVERRVAGRKAARMAGVPSWLCERLARAKATLGDYRVCLLGGHPTSLDLRRGHRADGLPVSVWNVHCDRVCRRLAFDMTAAAALGATVNPPLAPRSLAESPHHA